MKLTSREMFEELKKTMREEAIFRRCEFSQERFMNNLLKEEKGEVDQLVLKQHYRLYEMLPIMTKL